MTTQATEEKKPDTQTTTTEAPQGGAPQATPPAQAAPEKPAPAGAAPAAVKDGGEAGEGEGEGGGSESTTYTLSHEALRRRIARSTNKELEALFGTSDKAEIKKKLDRVEKLEAEAEKQRQAQLTELEREREARTKAEAKAAEIQAKFEETQNRQITQSEEHRLQGVAGEFLKKKYVRTGLRDFQDYVKEVIRDARADARSAGKGKDGQDRAEAKAVAKLDDNAIQKWFAAYAKENEDLALAPAAPPPARKELLDHGAGDEAPPKPKTETQPSLDLSSKSGKPKAEVNAYLAKTGSTLRI